MAAEVVCITIRPRRVVIATHKGKLLTSFGLDECPGGPHEARIVRRAALLGALRGAVPEQAIRYGASVAAVRATAQGGLTLLDASLARSYIPPPQPPAFFSSPCHQGLKMALSNC